MTHPDMVGFLAPNRSSYICSPGICLLNGPAIRIEREDDHCWHESLWRRLTWQYGARRANSIMLGRDKRTEVDRNASV